MSRLQVTREKHVMQYRTLFAIATAAILCGRPDACTYAENSVLRQTAQFKDVTKEMGLSIGNDAACWIDIDNDTWPDLITDGTVWHNNQGKSFTKIAEVGSVVAADFDNDGYPDLFSYSQMKLYHNIGGKRFEEVPLPKLPVTVSRGAAWGDLNGDGYVDLYVGGYEDWDRDITYPSMILINEHGKSFRLKWTENKYRTRGVTACDFNRDGKLDIYASNYRLQPNQLWLNSGNADLKDVAAEYNALATSSGFDGGHSIGSAWGDFDNDGEFDLFAGNFAHVDSRGDQPKSRFLKNLGTKGGFKFQDMGICGVYYQESYASPAAADFDNDGKLDLFFTTVYGTASFNRPNSPVLFLNEGNFKFTDATPKSGLENLPPTYQAAWADFDHDGNLDLVTGGKLFKNVSKAANRWIELRLNGDGLEVNKSAIGSQVRITVDHTVFTRQVEAGTGEGNQNDLILHFGLGTFKGHVNVQILWPNGKIQNLKHVATNRLISIDCRGGRKPTADIKVQVTSTPNLKRP